MIFRVLLIIINTILLVYSFQSKNLLFTTLVLTGILIIQIFIIYKKERSNQEKIIGYLESLIQEETYAISPSKTNSIYLRINRAFEDITDRFHLINNENQEKANLLNALLSHISIGLLTYNSDGHIGILNKSARNLLSISYLSNIKDLPIFTSIEISELLNFSKRINQIIKLENNTSLLIESSDFTLLEKQIRIISIQNIEKALDEKEQNSWNVLIKTLNHEIMNSITPISSLASSALSLVKKDRQNDLYEAIEIIDRRSRHLLSFVENFRTLSRIPTPVKELINIDDLLQEIQKLMAPLLLEKATVLILPEKKIGHSLYADKNQMEQILINLIKNSLEASATELILNVKMNGESHITIRVTDNGTGFSKESEEKAFIPFYTTKETGSGLGLSIVRQIMHLHDGAVKIQSETGKSTIGLEFS